MPTGFRLSSMLTSTPGFLAGTISLGVCLTGWTAADPVCPAPVATCTLPAPARHSDRVATYFHTSSVATTVTVQESECAEPIATCIQPAPQVAHQQQAGFFAPAERQTTVSELLHGWSASSSAHPVWTLSEKKWLARRHQPWLSAVALDSVMRLSSAVKETDLARDFTWTLEGTRDDVTVLHAVPKDETQQLFCPQLRVELDAATHALTAIDIADRAGTWRPIDLPWAVLPMPDRDADAIRLVANWIEIESTGNREFSESTDLPPVPSSAAAVRFASERQEFNVSTPR